QHAALLLVGVDRDRARPRRLAAHVDPVGAGVAHPRGMRHGVVEALPATAVAERVGRHVEHTEDRGHSTSEASAASAPRPMSASTPARFGGSARVPPLATVIVVEYAWLAASRRSAP